MNTAFASSSVPVWYEDRPVATIEMRQDGPWLVYEASWQHTPHAFPVSVTMPLNGAPVPPGLLIPWLSNLLPEGEPLRALQGVTGISADNVLSLLATIGRDTAGALSFGRRRLGMEPRVQWIEREADLERVINELPRKPFLAGEAGVSMSLAGAQQKLPVVAESGRIGIPLDGHPSTHILKPDHRVDGEEDRLAGSVQNEALCLELAALCGLSAARAVTGRAGKRSYLLVERYDRQRESGVVRRLHQEDFCQILGVFPSRKYEHDPANRGGPRGPGLKDLLLATRRHATPGSGLALLNSVIFNVLVTNVDSHAKNYSLILGPGRASLAPLYDVMVGAAYPSVTANMAQEIGGQRRARHLRARHWRRLADECGLNARLLLRKIEESAQQIERYIDEAMRRVEAMPAVGHHMLPLFVQEVRQNMRRITGNLKEPDDAMTEEPEEAAEPEDNVGSSLRLS